MKYILEIILILITITCFVFLMEYKRETSNLKAKLNQTNSILHKYINNDTTLNKEILTQEFKEDYYLTQQQLNQEQIVTFITLLFAIIAIIGTSIFFYALNSVKNDISTKYTSEYQNQQKRIHIAHNELNEIGYSFANQTLLTANAVKNIDQPTYVYQTLTALCLFKYFGYKLRTEEEINSLILTHLEHLNNEVSKIITTEQSQRNVLWGCLSDLTSLKNLEITTQVNLLRAKTNDQ